MAWTWLYSSSYNFGGYKEYRAFIGYDQANYASYSRCWWSIGVQMKYASQYGVTAVASGAASGSCEGYLSSSPGGTWKDVCRKDGYFDVTRTTAKQTKTVTSTAKGKTVSGMGSAGGSGVSKSYTYTIPALATYTIKYNANGSGASGAPGNQTKYYGIALKLSSTVPTRSGYKFLGWALTSGATTPYYTKTDNTCYRNENLTLYAVWERNTYTIIYKGNGNTDGKRDQSTTKTQGVAKTIESGDLYERNHYRFTNWLGSNGKSYAPGDLYTDDANITFFAQWEYNATKISYNLNGGEVEEGSEPEEQEIDVGSSGSLAEWDKNTMTPPSNTHFIGWNTKDDGTGIGYASGAPFKSENSNSNFILYAIYVSNYVLPKVNYTIKRVDANEKDSIGGKNLDLSFQCQKAIGSDGGKPESESYSLLYSTNGIDWTVYEGKTGNIDETETISINRITDIDSQPYKEYNFLVNIPYSIKGIDDNGNETTISGISSTIIPIPERKDNQQFVTITDFSAKRKTMSDTAVVVSFKWTPYYDGHEYYQNTTLNMVETVAGGSESNIPINLSGGGGTEVIEIVNLNLDDSAEIRFKNAESRKNSGDTPITSDLSNIPSAIIGEGGLPVHINSTGEGISLFGIARDDLSGFEVNGPTTFNKTLNVAGLINSSLNVNTSEKYGVFINNTNNTDSGIKITRSDKNYHMFVGIGTEGFNHGIWSEASSPGWLINKDSSTGKIYANNGQLPLNSNNILFTSGGVYMTGGQDYTLSQTVTEQMLGIVLVWSRYEPGDGPRDWGWEYSFIPKWHVLNQEGRGIYLKLHSSDDTTDVFKYVYLYNTHIKGHANNSAHGTGYDNRYACLRAIIGV